MNLLSFNGHNAHHNKSIVPFQFECCGWTNSSDFDEKDGRKYAFHWTKDLERKVCIFKNEEMECTVKNNQVPSACCMYAFSN